MKNLSKKEMNGSEKMTNCGNFSSNKRMRKKSLKHQQRNIDRIASI